MFCFPNKGPRGTWSIVFPEIMRRHVCELDEIWMNLFPRVLARDLYWGNKTFKLKRSINNITDIFRSFHIFAIFTSCGLES